MISANLSKSERRAIYKRDGYRCALCDNPANLITLCWRCHAEAHGTAIPERHTYQRTSWEDRQSLAEEYEQACTEYICDYYANMGVIADPVNGGGL